MIRGVPGVMGGGCWGDRGGGVAGVIGGGECWGDWGREVAGVIGGGVAGVMGRGRRCRPNSKPYVPIWSRLR